MSSSAPESTFSGVRPPFAVRAGNRIARRLGLARAGRTLQTDRLIATARRQTGLEDLGDPSFERRLERLTRGIVNEGRLTPFGVMTLRELLLDSTRNRLRVLDTCRRFDEIVEQPVPGPLFILGMYRSGTTFMHNLTGSLPGLRTPRFWELRVPCPVDRDRLDPRLADTERLMRRMNRARGFHRYFMPGFERAHEYTIEGPHECLHLFENAAVSSTAFFLTEDRSYAWWLLNEDLRPAYRFFRRQLQLLQWQRPGAPWVLKWPYHLWHLDALNDVFPDARFVWLHRESSEVLGSLCSMTAIERRSTCLGVDRQRLGRFWADYAAAGLERARDHRPRIDSRVYDVNYPDLVNDPAGTIAAILRHFDIDPGHEGMRPLRDYLDSDRARRRTRGGHHYTLEEFGLDPTELREQYRGLSHAGEGDPG